MYKIIIDDMPVPKHIEDWSRPPVWVLMKRKESEYRPNGGDSDESVAHNPAEYLLVLDSEGRRWETFLHDLSDDAIISAAEYVLQRRVSDLRAELVSYKPQVINDFEGGI